MRAPSHFGRSYAFFSQPFDGPCPYEFVNRLGPVRYLSVPFAYMYDLYAQLHSEIREFFIGQ